MASVSSANVQVQIDDMLVVSSGTVVVKDDWPCTISFGPSANPLVYSIKFFHDSNAQGGETVNIRQSKDNARHGTLELTNWNNSMGTNLGPIQIGTLEGREIWLSLYVIGMTEKLKVLHYTVYEKV
ncbi:MAG: hypothetical protein P8P99_00530 [Maricaulis sp.]|nr:hypothetical protein [Maricaulis sp.]